MADKIVNLTEKELEELMIKTVERTLIGIGVEHDKPIIMQKDFLYLRNLRESTEAIQRKTLLTAVGIVIVGISGAVLLALKLYFNPIP